jgi:hypothetical protein
MTTPSRFRAVSRIADQPIVRVLAYYLALVVGLLILHRFAPHLPGVFTVGRFDQLSSGENPFDRKTAIPLTPSEATMEGVIAMLAAYLLMLPVAWVHIVTRQKQGYEQSLVQTLVILPIVTAGVVILVKSSVALAFSLGGIVGAISFRNRLQDTKDAVSVFLAIGVGVACGVQVTAVAATLSVAYNLVNLTMWWTDFGRVPAAMHGPPAQKRLAELRAAQARKTGTFVAQVDSMLLKSMSPEQLDVVAEKARARRRSMAEDIGLSMTGELKLPTFDATIRIVVQGSESDAVRADVETLLAGQTKFWQFGSVSNAEGRQTVSYKVRCKKSVPGPDLLASVRNVAGARVQSVDLINL